jgi:heptose-I-phosphate ethanolaminephosphotransferase
MRYLRSNPLFWSLLVLTLPLLVEVTFSEYVREGEYNSRIGWSFITAFLITLANRRWATALILFPFVAGGMADIGYAYTFGGVFTTATIEAVAYTDSSEAGEFFSAYFSPGLFLLYILHWTVYVAAIYFVRPVHSKGAKQAIYSMGLLFIVVVSYRTTIMSKFHDTIPGVLGTLPSYYRGAISLQEEVDIRKKLVAHSNVAVTVNSPFPQTHIFVIGESLTRNHMGVYGYHRETTPYLHSYRNTGLFFTDTISSHAQTQASLRVALTAAGAEQGVEYRNALSAIDIANLAGYKTWWISNQQPQRATIASISHQADVPHYISNDYNGVEVARYDEYMLPVIQKALQDPAEKKAIFVHMMGSHAQYKNRFPEHFVHFTDNVVRTYQSHPSQTKVSAINDYDNSVLYSDYVIGQMISILEHSDTTAEKSLTYFSDHGEEVYQSANIKGHSPDNITANMLEIPLFIWHSKIANNKYQAATQNTDKPFRLDNFFHLAGNIMNIESEVVKDSLSPLSPDYQAPISREVYNLSYEQDLRSHKKSQLPAGLSPQQQIAEAAHTSK